MAANYYYGFGHGSSQFSLSSGSYPAGYSTPTSNARAPQQTYNEQHSQLQYGAFPNQLEQNASSAYGESKGYYMSTSQSTSMPSYSPSAGDEAKYSAESKYQPRHHAQSTSLNSDHASYLPSASSKMPYATGSKAATGWHNTGHSGSTHSSHNLPISDGLAAASQQSSDSGFNSSIFKATSSCYRDLAAVNPGPGNITSGGLKSFPFATRAKPRQPPKPSQLHYCEICRISCAGSQTYMEHLEGKNHKKREAQVKAAENSTSKSSSSSTCSGLRQLYCQLCDIACTGADTYAAHIRGAKHQKVLSLHTKLGKPIPEIPAADACGSTAKNAALLTSASGAKKVIVPVKLNFVGGSQLTTTGSGLDGVLEEKIDGSSGAAISDEPNAQEEPDIQPVGLEYIEESRNETGSAVSFHCRLCNCNFTDPLAKVMHTKGRRHRLHYKQKVDPSLQVIMKPSPNQKYQMNRQMMRTRNRAPGDDYWRQRYYDDPYRQEVEELRYEKELLQWQLSNARHEWYDRMVPPYHVQPTPLLMPSVCRQATETLDDRHVKAKHASIYPTENDLAAVQATVSDCENALRAVSDMFAALDESENHESLEADLRDDKEEAKDAQQGTSASGASRELKAVIRVGALSKGLLLHGDLRLELVVLCSHWPTYNLLGRVKEEFVKQLDDSAPGKYSVTLSSDGCDIVVASLSDPETICSISLSSLAVKEGSPLTELEADDPLDRSKCLESLAALRRAKWFQGKASGVSSCVILVRILKDLCERIPTWKPLSHWLLELLTEKCLSSFGDSIPPGTGLRRILECIASGFLFGGGQGLYDPCEKEPTDTLSSLTSQQREDITNSAQHALRLIAFGHIHAVLGMEALASQGLPAHRRKRQRADCLGQQGDSAQNS